METVIKNIHLLKPLVSEEEIQKLEHCALQYRKFARIYFKILGAYAQGDKTVVTIDCWQEKSPAENYLDTKELFKRCSELFAPLYSNSKFQIHTNTRKYVPNPTEIVTPEYLRAMLLKHKIKQKTIAVETGIATANISAWVNGLRPMSESAKAMFYYYFELVELRLSNSNIDNYQRQRDKAQDEE